MDVLLSIKPKYVKSIIEGNKRYEFRKTIFKNREINRIYIYSSSPVKKIVGTFEIGDILEDHPVDLWDTVKEYAGIDNRDFFAYFEGKSRAFAIEIQDLQEFTDSIDPYETMPGFVPPQSYCYMDGEKCSAAPR
ncbi:MAG: ASCH domain-containing protein [Methanoregula sp.]|nr:ASCH domain-containing protein [Methanoregula sp.]